MHFSDKLASMNKKQTFLLSSLMGISLAFAFVGGYLFHKYIIADGEFALLSEAHSLLLNNAFEEPPDDPALEYGMIRGMLQAYDDPYTVFVDPPQHELQSDNLEGSFGGIGAQVSRDADSNFILYPIPDGPADLAGVEDGDILIRVDDEEVNPEQSMDDVIARVRGPEGEIVTIVVLRASSNSELTFEIARGNIALPSVTWHLAADEARLGVIEINIVAASSADEVLNAVDDLSEKGATHFVLDLRGNRGGLLDAGIDVAALFLESGTIIERQYRGEEAEKYEVDEEGELAEIALIVLVDENTASAAEIIAGALQANGRAMLVGEQTFGKDSIQVVFELMDGSSIHVTTAKWWFLGIEFPVGDGGLIPDVILEPEETDVDEGMAAVIEILFGE